MTDLRERIDDLLGAVPEHVVADAGAAWGAGRRRRTRRRIGVAVAVMAAAAVIVPLSTQGVPHRHSPEPARDPSGGPDRSTSSYPTRIQKPLATSDLPARPGRVAGVVQRSDGWYAVSPTGALWRIPDSDPAYPAAVSPDGHWLAWMSTREGIPAWGAEDLRSGAWRASGIGAAGFGAAAGASGTIPPGTVTTWSPDNSQLLVPRSSAALRAHRPKAIAVSLVGGLEDETSFVVGLPAPSPGATPIGWAANHRIGWLSWFHGPAASRYPKLLITSDDSDVILRTVTLDIRVSQDEVRSALLVPDKDVVTVTTADRVFELGPTGLVVGRSRPSPAAAQHCPISWGIGQPWIATRAGAPDDAALVAQGRSPLIQADPRLHVGCSVWASSALDGAAHRGVSGALFGTSTSWLSWHWREAALVGSLALLLAFAALVVVRRRARGNPG